MKITDERTSNRKPFRGIVVGEAFTFNEDKFVKTELFEYGDVVRFNAIDLDVYKLHNFGDNVLVEPLNTELIIRKVLE